MSSSFSQKIIQVNFTLANGQFTATAVSGGVGSFTATSVALGNTKVVSDLRVNAEISKGGSPSKNEAKLRIYGMLEADMNTLSTLGFNKLAVQKNLIQVLAGDSDGLTTVFQGEITGAWVNYHTPPDLYFEVHAIAGYFGSLNPVQPTSIKGGTPVATIFQSLAGQMGLVFQNNGVLTTIQSPYLAGTAYQQALTLAQSVGIEFGIDDGILFISPRGTPRQPKGTVPLITPTTGMIEYPTWDKQGLIVSTLLNPAYQLNGQVVIQDSSIQRVNGSWRIHGLHHHIASKHPHQASWSSKLNLTAVGT